MSAAALAMGVAQGVRNGLFYGMKIRGPHATLMTFLFKWHDPLNVKLWNIVNLACTHARNLGSFALIYKALQLVLRRLLGPYAALISGGIGGYLIWGAKNSVNEQVNMYLFSRVVATGAHHLASKGFLPSSLPFMSPFQWFGTLVWAVVMFQFEAGHMVTAAKARTPGIFSMFKSMEYIYTDSDVTIPDNGSSSMAGWRGGITTPDNLLWALTVLLVSFQVYRYGPRWWAGAISTFSKWANPKDMAAVAKAAKDLADTTSVVGSLSTK